MELPDRIAVQSARGWVTSLFSLIELSGEVLLCDLTTGSLPFRTEFDQRANNVPLASLAGLSLHRHELNTLNRVPC
jgi:hypothetical protein